MQKVKKILLSETVLKYKKIKVTFDQYTCQMLSAILSMLLLLMSSLIFTPSFAVNFLLLLRIISYCF
jgi:IS4 transposase